jgi:ABC-2 type transport system ATP-binding protein/sodium transport system ATP-binding protein
MIVVHDLTKRFQSDDVEVLAVDCLSFRVQPGEAYGLLGPNGAGKTTTLRMIIGLLAPDEGFTEVAGFRTSDDPFEVRARIGLVSASDGVYPWLTVREMLLYFAELYGTPIEVAEERVSEISQMLEFRDYLDRRCIALSTGQKQRITLARALIHRPPVLLMDEPTRGLDVVASRTVFDYIQHAREQGIAIIVSTHRLEEAQRLCDRFGLLYRGRMAMEGDLASLQASSGRETLVEMFYDLMPSPDQGLVT